MLSTVYHRLFKRVGFIVFLLACGIGWISFAQWGQAAPPPATILGTDLEVNHDKGAPGSVLLFVGTEYPPNSLATITVNNLFLGTVNSSAIGTVLFLLDTTEGVYGRYDVRVIVGGRDANEHFDLEPDEPIWPAPPGIEEPIFYLEDLLPPTPTATLPMTPSVTPTATLGATPTPTSTAEPTATPPATATIPLPAGTLLCNFENGSPGSFFTFTGSQFPPNQMVTIEISSSTITRFLGSVPADGLGNLVFLINTAFAPDDTYTVQASNGTVQAEDGFVLESTAPWRPPLGSGQTFLLIPPTNIYLPLLGDW